jgi:outer membrane protein assembly factor BamA
MQVLIAIVGLVLFLPSTALSRPFSVDSLYEVLSERSSSSHNQINLGSDLGEIQSDTSTFISDSLKNSNQSELKRRNIEPFPILSYDTDTKFGYGAKLFLFNLFKVHESFDMVFFNSTNGEQWYHFEFSLPDYESREGTMYPIAVDFIFDYDKWLRNNFYGIGNTSIASDVEHYTRIPMDLELNISRGFSSTFVGQLRIKYRSVENYNFEVLSRLAVLPPSLNSETTTVTSVVITARYDSRNSFINASSGLVLQGESEYSPEWSLGNTSFTRLAGCIQYYEILFYPKTVLALRTGVQQVIGKNIPIQVMSSLGGTGTLRGYPQDRFLDKADILVNAELRFPIFWRFGGVVGLDAGKVWPSVADMDLQRWAYNPIAGLRFYMDNFVARADIGFGTEGTGFYFNFGQLF